MATMSYILLFLLNIVIVRCLKIQDLNGEWTVSEAAGKYENLTATVPGGIYTDLMNNKIIGDVFFGENDTETRCFALSNWTYKREFLADEVLLSHKSINLVFEGLDTFSTVLVNDVKVGTSQNMFLRYIFDVKKVLQIGTNTIEVQFVSPVTMAEALASKQGYPVPPDCPASAQNGECHVNKIRKMQASFSWDWGPALPSMGIWKKVTLEAFNSSSIRYFLVDYEETPDYSWTIKASTYLSVKKGETIQGKLICQMQTDTSLIQGIEDVNLTSTDDSGEIRVDSSFVIPTISVRKWWPNGYGEQTLYTLTATFESSNETTSTSVRIGFRKIELIQDPIGSGLSFYFKVNDVPIFAKGANEIPIDILPEKGQNPETISRVLESAYASNMNMLRVWGGGVYESDYFYDKTDELGILIWQDFMFACALYPTYPEYLDNVKDEIRHQVRRLKNHPSIAVWAGNNENELALMGTWYSDQNITVYKEDYIKLYVDTIRSELFNVTDNVLFVTSSPSNGKESERENYLATNPSDPLFGDVHFYNYLFNSLDPNTYLIPRFASEYGYQSLPDVDTWLTATNDIADLDPESRFMNHRQHHPFGLVENTLLIMFQLNVNSSVDDYYKTYIFYSQILQAMSIKFESEFYRSFMGRTDSRGQGNTMGALYWQLNDVWVAPTWSGIDYTGKWKMLQYFAKEFFAPTIITGYLGVSRQLQVYAVSEVPSLLGSSLNVSALVDVYNWNSFDPVSSNHLNVTLEFGKSIIVALINTDTYLETVGCGSLSNARTNCFFYLTLYSGNSVIAPHNFVLATSLKESTLKKTTVEVASIKQIDDQGKKFEISVKTDGISLFVWLDSHQILGRFSENGFLQVVPVKNITFQAEAATSESDLEKILTVVHLNNLQYQ